jgi:DNA-binding NtrC family response regulator
MENMQVSTGKSLRGISPEAYKKLFDFSWPGNVRQLRNVINKAAIFSTGDVITADTIQLDELNSDVSIDEKRKQREHYHLRNFNKQQWCELLKKHRGMVSEVANDLGATRKTCYRNFIKHDINPSDFRQI